MKLAQRMGVRAKSALGLVALHLLGAQGLDAAPRLFAGSSLADGSSVALAQEFPSGLRVSEWNVGDPNVTKPRVEQASVAAVTTDFSTGSLSILSTTPPYSAQVDLTAVCSDAVLRAHNGLLYVVNRFGCGSIQVVDPQDGTREEFSVGATSNPQDIAFVPNDRGYIPRYESNFLYEMDTRGGAIRDSIDLGVFADSDGLPEMHTAAFVDPYLYVALQRLDRSAGFEPVAPSLLAVIDTRTNQIVDTDPSSPELDAIPLEGTNPVGAMELVNREGGLHLAVATAGSFGDATDGGIEFVDLDEWQSTGRFVEGETLGGDPLHFALFGDTVFSIVSDPSFVTTLVHFTPRDATVREVVRGRRFDFNDCLVTSTGELWVADQYFEAPGVRIFDPKTLSEVTSSPISTGLPPFALVEFTAAAETPLPAEALAFPNPSRDFVRLQLPQGSIREIAVFDASGRLLQTLDPTRAFVDSNSGRTLLDWDGTDFAGQAVRTGSYWIRITEATGRRHSVPIRIFR